MGMDSLPYLIDVSSMPLNDLYAGEFSEAVQGPPLCFIPEGSVNSEFSYCLIFVKVPPLNSYPVSVPFSTALLLIPQSWCHVGHSQAVHTLRVCAHDELPHVLPCSAQGHLCGQCMRWGQGRALAAPSTLCPVSWDLPLARHRAHVQIHGH